jgi:UDP-N-acetylmuramoyl-tripeptide--D-alanyl-D-alanine ligase
MMRAFSLAEARQWLGLAPDPGTGLLSFTGVCTDTRRLQPGDLFVALRGDRFDGHRFLSQARATGAVAAVVETPDPAVALPQLVVPDAVQALARLALGNRNESQVGLVAVTGSSGKTTVREMTASILSEMGPTLATEGNLNNHIGVPLTLFRLAPEHRFAAVELGASGLGEIAHTVAIVRPRVVILTNAGQAHLEGFGSYDNIVRAKGEIIEGVTPGGLVLLNRDDPAFARWRERAGKCRVACVSAQGHPEADYVITGATMTGEGQRLSVSGPNGWHSEPVLPLLGEHNRLNALLAVAAARELGASDAQVIAGLQAVKPVPGRLQPLTLTKDLTVIDDSYNANPASMKAALAVLAGFPGQRIAVLGAMAELGREARRWHQDVGATARACGIERLLVVGPGCEGYLEGYGPAAEFHPGHEAAVAAILRHQAGPTTVLVKGSRSSAMDRVVDGLKEKVNNACCSG